MRTEESRLQHSLSHLRELMRRMRHLPLKEQVINLNQVLRGHYGYYGIAGNFRALQRVHRFVERYWYKMLCSRSRKGYFPWEVFHRIKGTLAFSVNRTNKASVPNLPGPNNSAHQQTLCEKVWPW